MIRKIIICTALLALLTVVRGSGAEFLAGTVNTIIDGDSLLLSTDTKKIEIRLYGIDCPEYRQPYSRAAKKFVQASVSGSRVQVLPYYNDAYGRSIAMVFIGERALNGDLVEAGLAWVHPAYCHKPICREWKDLEKRARQEKRGLWQEPKAIPPWQWKKMKKGKWRK